MIDILLPVYNREQFLEECLDSLFRQTYQDFKILIYDDGSTDNSVMIALKYFDKYPDKMKIIVGEENRGVGYSRNRLFEMAKETNAEYCIWQDSDDVSRETRLEYMLKAIQEQNVDMLFSEMYFFMNGEKYTRTRTIHRIDITKYTDRGGLHNNMNFATAIFKKSLISVPFRDRLLLQEDAQWLSDLMQLKVRFGYLPIPLYYCRRHAGRLTNHGRFNNL